MAPTLGISAKAPKSRSRAMEAAARAESRGTDYVGWRAFKTPVGKFILALDERGNVTTGWEREGWPPHKSPERTRLQPDLSAALERYFAGEGIDFIGFALPAGTDFQQACWLAARKVPRGKVISYAELAKRAGSPGAARAAGQAMRNNPAPIVVPCHRVVGSDGELHGFGGSMDPKGKELHIKKWLLELEQTVVIPVQE